MTLTAGQRRMLDAVVRELPSKFDITFELLILKDEETGACTTYSRILAEVLSEFNIKAEVRPVYIVTANRLALDYLRGKITAEESLSRGGRIQVWGDIKEGQKYQHAICYIRNWDVVVDLAMEPRLSRQVPCHPYWARRGEFPWWLATFKFSAYRLEYRGYLTYPDKVREAKRITREVIRRAYAP